MPRFLVPEQLESTDRPNMLYTINLPAALSSQVKILLSGTVKLK